jgi:AAA+ ATPase superfamily predicted ATPase
MQDSFPLGLATGEAFCNREVERQHLLSNIQQGKPTLIVSPRRYGKTSLVLQAIRESKLPYAHMDFFAEITQEEIIKNILKGIGSAIGKVASTPQRAMNAVKEFFSGAQVKFSIDIPTIAIEFDTEPQNSKEHLKTILERFEVLASRKKKKVILFFDEFQRLGQVVKDYSIEAILRHAAQQSKNIIFIFSGSNRHLLGQMFDDRTRPFYKLCDRIYLERIHAKHYYSYMHHAFKIKWKPKLAPALMDLILNLTERHPYYVNLLCSRLWLMSKLPTEQDVQRCWIQLAIEEKSQIASELDLLSDNQRALLITLAKTGKNKALQSKEFLTRSGLSASSTAQSLAVLEERDYVHKDALGYYALIDPLLRSVINL